MIVLRPVRVIRQVVVTGGYGPSVGVHPGAVAEDKLPHRALVGEAEAFVYADSPLVALEHDQPESGEIEPVVGEVDQFGAQRLADPPAQP